MTGKLVTRRGLLRSAGLVTAAAGATVFGPWKHNRVHAAASDKPLKLGLTSDASGQYANSGASDRRGMLMAVEELNAKGGVLGRRIETIHLDTETTPATGSRVAERLITRDEVSFLIGAVSSGVANAVSQVAQKYGTVYLNTNSSSPSESGEDCHRVKFVWDGNGTNFAKAAVSNAIKSFGKGWLLLTNDYVWGHNTSKATRSLAEAAGAEIVDEILVPQGTRDFSAILLKVQQAGPDVIAAAVGGDDQKAMRQQVAQLGMGEKPAWINNQQDWPDVYGLPLDNLFGVFGTTWYYKLDLPGVEAFVARYQEAYPDTQMRGRPAEDAAGRGRARRLDRQHQGHQGAGAAEGLGRRPYAAFRCPHEPGHPSDATDDLPGDRQPGHQGSGRPVQDPLLVLAQGDRGQQCGRGLQARALRGDAELRDLSIRLRRPGIGLSCPEPKPGRLPPVLE